MNQNVKTCESSKILNGISFFGNTLELKKEKRISISALRIFLKEQYAISNYNLEEYVIDKEAVGIILNGKRIGYILVYKPFRYGLIVKPGDVFIDYAIEPKYRNKGIGKQALKLFLELNVEEMFGASRIVAVIWEYNGASINCAFANGMERIRNYYIMKYYK